jgi:hypothetical protein
LQSRGQGPEFKPQYFQAKQNKTNPTETKKKGHEIIPTYTCTGREGEEEGEGEDFLGQGFLADIRRMVGSSIA